MAQVKYIYLSGTKSNDPLHIVYVPNVFNLLRFQQKEPNNHSNGMNEHKSIEGDQT